MSLESVVENIREEAHSRAEEIRSAADDEAEEILESARAEAEETREAAETAAEREIEQLREREVSGAELEAKQERLAARRDLLADVREQVESELADLSGDDRESLTRALFEAAQTEFDDDASLEVYGHPDDADLLSSVVEDADAEVAGDYDCLGGVVVESPDSRVRVNNTFDSVLESVWADNLQEISNHLFEQ